MGRFLAFRLIFVIWFDFWLLGQYLDSGSILGDCVDFLSTSGLWFDFWLLGRFLAFEQFLSFELIFGFWVNVWVLGQFLAIGSFFVDFWPLGRFLAFGTIFGFLDDFCPLV